MPKTDLINSKDGEFQPVLDHLVRFYNNQLENRLVSLAPKQYKEHTHGVYHGIADILGR
jgi:hypothetical protein